MSASAPAAAAAAARALGDRDRRRRRARRPAAPPSMPRVMPAEMADADRRPTPRADAALTTPAPGSDHDDAGRVGGVDERRRRRGSASGRRRSTTRRRRPRASPRSSRTPTTGTSKRMSCGGLATLTTRVPGAGQRAGARDRRVGAFHRLDRHHGAILDDDRLADVEAGDRVGDAVAEREVGAHRRRSAARASARPASPADPPAAPSNPSA